MAYPAKLFCYVGCKEVASLQPMTTLATKSKSLLKGTRMYKIVIDIHKYMIVYMKIDIRRKITSFYSQI